MSGHEMASGFSDQFQQYLIPDQAAVRQGMTRGLVVLDTNVLLSAYRFAPNARAELLNVLTLLADRLWIPHQVAFEFHKNRFGVIAEYDAAYNAVIESLREHQQASERDLEDKIRQLTNRAALTDHERDRLLGMLRTSLSPLQHAIETLRREHGVGNPASSQDEILERMQRILMGRVGSPFDEKADSSERAEADRRIREQIPPGYRDSGKPEGHGDYFVWAQTLREAKRRSPEILVFVTGDVKDDWYLRIKGQTVMARPELALECREETGAKLVMMQTKAFLRHAEAYLNAKVSDAIRQADRMSEANEAATKKRAENRRGRELAEIELRLGMISSALDDVLEEEKAALSRMLAMSDYIEATQTAKGTNAIASAQHELFQIKNRRSALQEERYRLDARRQKLEQAKRSVEEVPKPVALNVQSDEQE